MVNCIYIYLDINGRFNLGCENKNLMNRMDGQKYNWLSIINIYNIFTHSFLRFIIFIVFIL